MNCLHSLCSLGIQLKEIVAEVDYNGDGVLDFTEFTTMCQMRSVPPDAMDRHAAFKFFCMTSSGGTELTKADMKQVMSELNEPHTDADIDKIFADCDKNGDGKLDEAEFLAYFDFQANP